MFLSVLLSSSCRRDQVECVYSHKKKTGPVRRKPHPQPPSSYSPSVTGSPPGSIPVTPVGSASSTSSPRDGSPLLSPSSRSGAGVGMSARRTGGTSSSGAQHGGGVGGGGPMVTGSGGNGNGGASGLLGAGAGGGGGAGGVTGRSGHGAEKTGGDGVGREVRRVFGVFGPRPRLNSLVHGSYLAFPESSFTYA